ncbi:hypothetical protein T439DRAFT_173560 [Meredithblackwellia eburnea MCA 4105]
MAPPPRPLLSHSSDNQPRGLLSQQLVTHSSTGTASHSYPVHHDTVAFGSHPARSAVHAVPGARAVREPRSRTDGHETGSSTTKLDQFLAWDVSGERQIDDLWTRCPVCNIPVRVLDKHHPKDLSPLADHLASVEFHLTEDELQKAFLVTLCVQMRELELCGDDEKEFINAECGSKFFVSDGCNQQETDKCTRAYKAAAEHIRRSGYKTLLPKVQL